MEKSVLVIAATVLLSLLLVGSQFKPQLKNNDSETIYEQVIGFLKTDKVRKPIKENIVLLKSQQEWNSFSKKYLQQLPIPDVSLKGKYVIVTKVDWTGKDPTAGNRYAILGISFTGKNMVVAVKKQKEGMTVDPVSPDYRFSYVIISSVSSKGLPKNVKPIIKIIR